MYEKLLAVLWHCGNENVPCEGCPVHDECGNFDIGAARNMREAADAIEELSRVADAIPHVCECCIGCEVEKGGCDRCFVLSPKRAMEYLSKPRWIPVTEQCPEKSGDYLVFDDCRNLYVNEWHCLLKKWQYDDSRITHWQPLPEPPKEEA